MSASQAPLQPDAPAPPAAGRRRITLGPVELLFEAGDIRYVRAGSCEIVRRVHVTVCDPARIPVCGVMTGLRVETRGSLLHIAYHCEHQAGEIDFAWDALISGRVRGERGRIDVELSFAMSGVARSTFRTSCAGICVLHPVAEYAGRACAIRDCAGGERAERFPRMIAPEPVFTGIRGIVSMPAPGLRAELVLAGEAFETEDQRNWAEMSFKTCCRPLAAPLPYTIERGQAVRQSVTLHIAGRLPGRRIVAHRQMLRIGPALGDLPAIGLRAGSGAAAPAGPQIQRLQELHSGHLRVELRLAEGSARAALERGAEEARALGVPLELALFLPEQAADPVRELAEALRRLRPDVARWIVYRDRAPVTPPEDVSFARHCVAPFTAAVPVGGGTIGSFAELNRRRPDGAGADFLAYAIDAQVHASDDLALVENLAAQADTVAAARAFAPAAPLVISPVSLHRRPDPRVTGGDGCVAALRPDPRQESLLGAAWTAGSLKYLAEAGAASITYYETIGPYGVMEGESVFPLYHVLADAGVLAAGQVWSCRSSDPLEFDGLLVQRWARRRLIVAVFAAGPVTIDIEGAPRTGRMLRLDGTTVEDATRAPEAFRCRLESVEWPIRLAGPGVARIDFDGD